MTDHIEAIWAWGNMTAPVYNRDIAAYVVLQLFVSVLIISGDLPWLRPRLLWLVFAWTGVPFAILDFGRYLL